MIIDLVSEFLILTDTSDTGAGRKDNNFPDSVHQREADNSQVHTSTDNSEHKNQPRIEDSSTPADQNNDLPAVEDDLEFESLEPLAIVKRNELSSSMRLQRPNRISIMFDTNM